MTKQPEPLRIAEQLKDLSTKFPTPSHDRGVVNSAIDELRRLHEANAELLEALRMSAAACRHALAVMPIDDPLLLQAESSERNARAAIAKATGEPE